MSKIIRKVFQVRKYENIDHEINRRGSRVQDITSPKGNGPNMGALPLSYQEESYEQEIAKIKEKEQALCLQFKGKSAIEEKDL